MLESSQYRIIAASLESLAREARREADAIDNGLPRECGISGLDLELLLLQATMMHDGTINKGMVAEILGKSVKSVELYIANGKLPEGIEEKHGHGKRWSRAMVEYIANKKAYIRKQAKRFGII
jgi:hypothetical protein